MTKFMAFCIIALVASLLYPSYTHETLGRETLTFDIQIPTPTTNTTNTTTSATASETTNYSVVHYLQERKNVD